MIDLNQTVRTRDGREARIVSTHMPGRFPLLAVITNPDGTDTANRYTAAGKYFGVPGEHDADLVNLPQETEEFRNVYLKGFHEDDQTSYVSHAYYDEDQVSAALREQNAADSFTIRIERYANGTISDVSLWNRFTPAEWPTHG